MTFSVFFFGGGGRTVYPSSVLARRRDDWKMCHNHVPHKVGIMMLEVMGSRSTQTKLGMSE